MYACRDKFPHRSSHHLKMWRGERKCAISSYVLVHHNPHHAGTIPLWQCVWIQAIPSPEGTRSRWDGWWCFGRKLTVYDSFPYSPTTASPNWATTVPVWPRTWHSANTNRLGDKRKVVAAVPSSDIRHFEGNTKVVYLENMCVQN